MPTTPVLGLPYPASTDTADVPRDMQALAVSLDAQPSFTPVGAIFLWTLAALPAGLLTNGKTAFLFANGQIVSATDYPKLAALLGAPGGNVTIPDLRDRVPLGASATKALGTSGGEEKHTIAAAELPAHTHADTIGVVSGGAHTHPAGLAGYSYVLSDDADVQEGYGSANTNVALGWGQLTTARVTRPTIRGAANTLSAGAHTHAKSGAVLASAAPTQQTNVMQPYLSLNYVMRAA